MGAYTPVRPSQHQQNRRGRGRNNNNGSGGGGGGGSSNHVRKGQNPLSRSFESNGPDVKVRGTPAHIAEKYLQLARDAQSAGDRVLAENYLQHAEHYNRIIMAYREQFQTPGEQGQAPRRDGMEGDDAGDDEFGEGGQDDFGGGPQPGAAPAVAAQGGGEPGVNGNHQPQRPQHQPRQDNRPDNRPDNRYDRPQGGQQGGQGDGQQRGDRPFRRDGQQQQNRFRDRNDRNFRPNSNAQGERGDRPYEQRYDRGDRPPQQRPDQRPDRQDFRQDRGQDRNQDRSQDRNQDRGPRPERFERQDRPDAPDRVMPQAEAPRVAPIEAPGFVAAPLNVPPPMAAEPVAAPAVAPAPRRRERLADQPSEQPEFLKRPVRRTRAAVAPAGDAADKPKGGDDPSSTS